METPTPQMIRAARASAGHSQTEAAQLVGSKLRAWQGWEAPSGAAHAREMPSGLYELYLLKTGQHPDFIMAPRAGATG